jgi:2-C-methyl-D-erythritol 2,4-cyclodiphosphate synthase
MGLDQERISVKATTTERLGFVGQEEGVSAYVVVLIHKD